MSQTYDVGMTPKELAVRRSRQADILKALEGVLHHNSAVKSQYQLPQSLIRQVELAVGLQRNNVADFE